MARALKAERRIRDKQHGNAVVIDRALAFNLALLMRVDYFGPRGDRNTGVGMM